MKKIVLVISILLCLATSVYGQVFVSLKADVSSDFPNVIEEKTRVQKFVGQYSILYLDSLDSTYMCEVQDFNYFSLYYTFLNKWKLPFRSKVSDMYYGKLSYLWFCGKEYWLGNGMYGWMLPPNSPYSATPLINITSLDGMDELKNVVVVKNGLGIDDLQMFAIGATSQENIHVLDLGCPFLSSLPYDYASGDSSEYFDDLDIVENYAVLASRELRPNNVYVNLRVMDIWNGLSDSQIDTKWRLDLPPNEEIYGKVFVEYLDESRIEVCYIKYSFVTGYVLCLHMINLNDMVAGIQNTLISQEIPIEKGEFIQDLVYDKHEKILVVMMDKDENHSVFLHTFPLKTENYLFPRFESNVGDRYFSIDTLASYSYNPARMYQAWGGTKCFEQRFVPSGTVSGLCIPYKGARAKYVDPINILKIFDPLTRDVGARYLLWEFKGTQFSTIYSNCLIDGNQSLNE